MKSNAFRQLPENRSKSQQLLKKQKKQLQPIAFLTAWEDRKIKGFSDQKALLFGWLPQIPLRIIIYKYNIYNIYNLSIVPGILPSSWFFFFLLRERRRNPPEGRIPVVHLRSCALKTALTREIFMLPGVFGALKGLPAKPGFRRHLISPT